MTVQQARRSVIAEGGEDAIDGTKGIVEALFLQLDEHAGHVRHCPGRPSFAGMDALRPVDAGRLSAATRPASSPARAS